MIEEAKYHLKREVAQIDVGLIKPNIDTLVCSHGGCGTTFFMDFLSKERNVNDAYDQDGLKHLRCPPRRVPNNCKVIYLYGDPVDAVASLFRRRYAVQQAHKFGNLLWRECTDIRRYAELGIDKIGLNKVIKRWTQEGKSRSYNIIMIKYEKIWKNLSTILEINEMTKYKKYFPDKKERQVDVDEYVKRDLEKIYSPFYQNIKNLDDLEVL